MSLVRGHWAATLSTMRRQAGPHSLYTPLMRPRTRTLYITPCCSWLPLQLLIWKWQARVALAGSPLAVLWLWKRRKLKPPFGSNHHIW